MVKKSHVYTRSGDKGTTSLVGGERVKKCSLRLEAYGTVDELNAHIGLLASMVRDHPKADLALLRWIQSALFDAGTHLATPTNGGVEAPCSITMSHVEKLERSIDELDAQVPPLRTFVLPGGSILASQCHVCRTVCRRAERLSIALAEEVPVSPLLLSFVNRLSDFFFVYARFLNKMDDSEEISWKSSCE